MLPACVAGHECYGCSQEFCLSSVAVLQVECWERWIEIDEEVVGF